jgi:hypothetical protein
MRVKTLGSLPNRQNLDTFNLQFSTIIYFFISNSLSTFSEPELLVQTPVKKYGDFTQKFGFLTKLYTVRVFRNKWWNLIDVWLVDSDFSLS